MYVQRRQWRAKVSDTGRSEFFTLCSKSVISSISESQV